MGPHGRRWPAGRPRRGRSARGPTAAGCFPPTWPAPCPARAPTGAADRAACRPGGRTGRPRRAGSPHRAATPRPRRDSPTAVTHGEGSRPASTAEEGSGPAHPTRRAPDRRRPPTTGPGRRRQSVEVPPCSHQGRGGAAAGPAVLELLYASGVRITSCAASTSPTSTTTAGHAGVRQGRPGTGRADRGAGPAGLEAWLRYGRPALAAPDPRDALLLGARGRAANPTTARQIVGGYAEAAGLPPISPARAAPLRRHPPARGRRRPARRPGTAGPLVPGEHPDLHPRVRGAAPRRLPPGPPTPSPAVAGHPDRPHRPAPGPSSLGAATGPEQPGTSGRTRAAQNRAPDPSGRDPNSPGTSGPGAAPA